MRANFVSNARLVLALLWLLLPLVAVAEHNTVTLITNLVDNGGATFFVGNTGTNNSLRIQSGGVLTNVYDGIIGNESGANNNQATVTDPNSAWFNSRDVYVGNNGSGNLLTIINGGLVSNTFGYIGYGAGASNNAVLVSGTGSVWNNRGHLYVGYYGSSNQLTIQSGGVVNNINGYISSFAGANNNAVLVSGTGSVWNNSGGLFVGHNDSSNQLTIQSGGVVNSAYGYIGSNAGANNNTVLVNGTGSVWNNSGHLFVGYSGSSNQLTIQSGGVVNNEYTGYISPVYIGYNAGANNNAVLVSGTGSVWNNYRGLYVGYSGSSNRLTIQSGGVVSNTYGIIGFDVGANNNAVLVSGTGSVWNNSGYLYIGYSGFSNQLTILSGGVVSNTYGYIGYEGGANNTVLVSGSNSVWNNTGELNIGYNSSGNSLVISNGGTVRNTFGNIGSNAGSTGNEVIVTGTGSRWINALDLNVGLSGSSNRFIIADGGYASNRWACVGNFTGSVHNAATVTGAGSYWRTSALRVGAFSSSNTLTIAAGGIVESGEGYIGSELGGNDNIVIVTGEGSQWKNGSFHVGYSGNGNLLIISNRGVVSSSSFAEIGYGGGSDRNCVIVSGSGSIFTNSSTLCVGVNGGYNSLMITNGGTVVSGGSTLGQNSSSMNNTVTVTGANSVWRNSNLYVGDNGSGNALLLSEGGQVLTATKAVIGNGPAASNNVVRVNGTGSEWNVANLLTVGGSGAGNRLEVTNGGRVLAGGLLLDRGTLAFDAESTVHITGSYTQTLNGVLSLGIGGTNAGEYAQLQVDNIATLGGTLRLLPIGGYTPQTNHVQTIIQTSGGVTGQFDTVESLIAGVLSPQLDYSDGFNVVLQWVLQSFVPFAHTPNQMAVAVALDSAVKDPNAQPLIHYLGSLPGEEIPPALDLIAPDELTALYQLVFGGMDARGYGFLSRIQELRAGSHGFNANRLALYDSHGARQPVCEGSPLMVAPCNDIFSPSKDNPWGLYLEGEGEFTDVHSDANANGYRVRSGGLTVGLDRRINEHFVVGLTLGYADVTASLVNDGRVDVDSGQASVYAAWFHQGFYLAGMLNGSLNSYDTRRTAIGGTARGSTDGTAWGGLINTGYDWQKGIWYFGPQASLQYQQVNIDEFVESDSLSDLRILSQSEDALNTRLGAHLGCRAKCGKAIVSPDLSVAWQHEFLNDSLALDSRFANGAGNVFTVHGPQIGRDSVVLGVGLWVQWNPVLGTWLSYNAQFARDNYQPHNISGGIALRF